MVKPKKSYGFITLFLAIVSTICVYFGLTYSPNRVLKYSETGVADYKVYLKNNDFFDVPYLEKGRKYIASLIDHIDVEYNYKFEGNQSVDYKLSYYIEAYTSVLDSSSTKKVLYDKEKKLTEPKTIEFKNSSTAEIAETISINYDEYNEIIKQFVDKYGVGSSAVSNLDLKMVINLEASANGFENIILDESKIALSIPLTNLAIDMEINYDAIDNRGEKIEYNNSKLGKILFFADAALSFIFCMIFLIKAIKNKQMLEKLITPYERAKNNILFKYNNMVAQVQVFPKNVLEHIVAVTNFEDLVLISDILAKPILYKELDPKNLSWFITIDETITYIFILKK